MRDQSVQDSKVEPTKPAETIHLRHIHCELLERGRIPPPEGMSRAECCQVAVRQRAGGAAILDHGEIHFRPRRKPF